MPGKVNPVIPEVVSQVAFDIIGKDVTITMAAEAGQLELNVMEPIIAFSLSNGIHRLRQAMRTLQDRCVSGITAVSYTHLDVYKRQVQDSGWSGWGTRRKLR